MTPTKHQIIAAIEASRAIADAIRELGEVPEGHLYARLTGVMDIHQFGLVVRLLADSGLVERRPGPILRWVGRPGIPKPEPQP